MRKGKALAGLAIGVLTALSFLGSCGTANTDTPEPTATQVQTPEEYPPLEYPDEDEVVYIPISPDHEDPWSGWSDDLSRLRIKPLEVELDSFTQWDIFKVCDYKEEDFCLLMAIAYHETGGTFDTAAIGDAGGSIGLFQINVKWHTDRMERLGVTDLTDPTQCAQVALDYVRELSDRYGFEPYTEALLMSYNMGPAGAKTALKNGTTSTRYSREVFATYQGFLAQMGGDAE